MKFKEDLQRLSVQVSERKQHIINEEMTKQALIIPFLQVLGFDVFNPLEVMPEFVADFGKKKGEKVDYAIFKNNKPIIFIEAKAVTENSSSHDAQLARYFNSTPEVKLAIITNGVIYKFFTDLDTNNVMDANPFTTIDITNLSPGDIEILNRFRKDIFDTDALVKYAEELIYTSNLNNKLRELFKNPPDDFIRYLIKDFSDTRITTNVIERFRPIVKKSIQNALLELVSQGLSNSAPPEETTEINIQHTNEPEIEVKTKKEINTTDEELRFFEIIKKILASYNKNVSDLGYKDTTSYFAIYNKNVNNWFIRAKIERQNKFIITKIPADKVMELADSFRVESAPKGHGESRVFINSIEDLNRLANLVVECFNDITM